MFKHFKRAEFACKCGCGLDVVDVELLELCEFVRALNGNLPLTVLSGCRCHEHNAEIGGTPHSQHLIGKAADLLVENPEEVYEKLLKTFPTKYGFGLYEAFVHVDVRSKMARWDFTNTQ